MFLIVKFRFDSCSPSFDINNINNGRYLGAELEHRVVLVWMIVPVSCFIVLPENQVVLSVIRIRFIFVWIRILRSVSVNYVKGSNSKSNLKFKKKNNLFTLFTLKYKMLQ